MADMAGSGRGELSRSERVRQRVSMFERMLEKPALAAAWSRPPSLELSRGSLSSWPLSQPTSSPESCMRKRCYDDEDGGHALGASSSPRLPHVGLRTALSCSSSSSSSSDDEASAPALPEVPDVSAASPTSSDSDASDSPEAPLSGSARPSTQEALAPGDAHAAAARQSGSAAGDLARRKGAACIELTEWTGVPGDAKVAASTDGGESESPEMQALRYENERLRKDLQRTQTLLMQKKAELQNMKGVCDELVHKRGVERAQHHNAKQNVESMQYEAVRLMRCQQLSREVISEQQRRIERQDTDLQEVTKRMLAAENALAVAQRNSRALRSQNAALEKKLQFLERLQLVESSLESVCARSYTHSIELY